jgi:hypothetical protein
MAPRFLLRTGFVKGIMGPVRRSRQSLRMKTLLALFTLTALLLSAAPSEASVNKCKAKDGSVTYTQTACPPGTSNADFPQDVDPNRAPPGTKAVPGSSASPASTRAATYRDAAYNCALKDEDTNACGVINNAIAFCDPEANWNSEVCVDLLDGLQAARSELNSSGNAERATLREACASRGQFACTLVDCLAELSDRGTDQQLRTCATRIKLPATGEWVKVDARNMSGGNSTGRYLCLKRLQRATPTGQLVYHRESINVVSLSGEFAASSISGETFASAQAAASAGCRAKTSPPKPEVPPAFGKKKKSQSI